jgi:hypothetical protein
MLQPEENPKYIEKWVRTTAEFKKVIISDLGEWVEIIYKESMRIAKRNERIDFLMTFNALINFLMMVMDGTKYQIMLEQQGET